MADPKIPPSPAVASPKGPNVEIKQAPGYRQIYANNVAIRATNWDFLLDFGKVVSASADTLIAESEVGVYLSPPQAKALLGSLGTVVAQYEKMIAASPTQSK